MNVESLLYDSSRKAIEEALLYCDLHPDSFNYFFDLAVSDTYPMSMRAARVIQLYFDKYPQKINTYLHPITEALYAAKGDGLKRSFIKILFDHADIMSIPTAGYLFDSCLQWLSSDKESIAVRVYSMDICLRFVKNEPDLKNELILLLESIPFNDSPGLRHRRKKALKFLYPIS